MRIKSYPPCVRLLPEDWSPYTGPMVLPGEAFSDGHPRFSTFRFIIKYPWYMEKFVFDGERDVNQFDPKTQELIHFNQVSLGIFHDGQVYGLNYGVERCPVDWDDPRFTEYGINLCEKDCQELPFLRLERHCLIEFLLEYYRPDQVLIDVENPRAKFILFLLANVTLPHIQSATALVSNVIWEDLQKPPGRIDSMAIPLSSAETKVLTPRWKESWQELSPVSPKPHPAS